jgi:tyrosine decarboxylase/aspartate 1-decarboxylase
LADTIGLRSPIACNWKGALMTFEHESLVLLSEALRCLEEGFGRLPDFAPRIDPAALREALLAAAERMRDNYPYHHPLYVGQMLKPPHPAARLAYALATWINPNNHALDGGRASSAMEKEAVEQIARMFGWETHLGHLCGGGTMANFEALWVGRELRPGKAIAASDQAHYTHARLAGVLGVPFRKIAVDARGRMDIAALEAALAGGEIGTVVVTLGTTGAGTVDPLAEILALRGRYDFQVHVDAAYGGYFTLASNLGAETRRAFDGIGEADSVVVDPHKHGLQPYGCGCVLFRDPSVGRFYRHDSPYTYFTSLELHLGEISLECSRPGASAVALWTTLRLLPLVRGGDFAEGLDACRQAALMLHEALDGDGHFVPLFPPELDIVAWAVRARSANESSARARLIFEAAAKRDLHLALATFPRAMVEASGAVSRWDAEGLLCLRACVMKPEHGEWMPEIVARLQGAAGDVFLCEPRP